MGMKPFTLAFLKCNKCTFDNDLELKIETVKKNNLITDPSFIKDYLEKNNDKFLEDVKKSFSEYEASEDTYFAYSEDIEGLTDCLMGNFISEGELKCKQCSRIFEIKDGIPDFLI